MAKRQQPVELPNAVAAYLRQISADYRFQTSVVDALQAAPCSIRAFASIHRRLTDWVLTFDADGVLREPVQVIARKTVEAGSRWYVVIHRGNEKLIRNGARKLADAAQGLYDALWDFATWPQELGYKGNALNRLLRNISDAGYVVHGMPLEFLGHENDSNFTGELGRLYNLAREVEDEALTPEDPAYFQAAVKGYHNPIPAFVASLDQYVAELVDEEVFPHDFRLSDSEMAGLAWAATEQGDLSPVINRRSGKDSRAERVRKIRAGYTRKISSPSDQD